MSGQTQTHTTVPSAKIFFIALFTTALITAQVISSKLLYVTMPFLGLVTFPGGTITYAVTFFATDTIGEVWGKSLARRTVNIAFAMNFVLFAFIFWVINAPAAPGSIDPQAFNSVIGSGMNVIAGSLTAYIVSQNWDVFAFHSLRERMGQDHLWVRNLASTGSSQLIDTVIFTTVAFMIMPALFGGFSFPLSVAISAIIGQYILKLGIAVVDTPLVYVAVHWLRESNIPTGEASPHAG